MNNHKKKLFHPTDKEEKMRILNGVETIPCIKKKAKWAMNWIKSNAPFSQRLIAFAIMCESW